MEEGVAQRFCGLILDEQLAHRVESLKEEAFQRLLSVDMKLLFLNWDYQTQASTELSRLMSELADHADFGFFIAPCSYKSRFKGFVAKAITWFKWFVFNKILLRFLYPALDKDYQFKMTLINVLEAIRQRMK